MPALDLEAEYNNRKRVPAHAEHAARWQAASAAYRQAAKGAELDLAYGPSERNRYDLFRAGDPKAALVVYIHGGYWQRGDRKDYSFLAKELNAAGIDVALPSYTLCPAASVMDIIGELRACLIAIWKKTGKRPGRHRTFGRRASDGARWWQPTGARWRTRPPISCVPASPISGVFELEPLIPTSINDLVGLDAAAARAASPLLWPPPPKGRRLVAAVGGDESSEFLRQSPRHRRGWAKAGLETECLVVPGTNHFSVVDELAKPGSALFKAVVRLARG